jgi:hypothetical protein
VLFCSESTDPYRDIVNPNAGFIHSGKESRMWLVGGGYIGQKNNNFVRKIIGEVYRLHFWPCGTALMPHYPFLP